MPDWPPGRMVCKGYIAFLRGKRVTYRGRTGDQHMEWFPDAEPAKAD